MNVETKLAVVQNVYATQMAETTSYLTKAGLLETIVEEKRPILFDHAERNLQAFGITKPEDVFLTLSDIFSCAKWQIETTDHGFRAINETCKLCATAKSKETDSPCDLYCLVPMESMVKGLSIDYMYKVESTLWDAGRCSILVTK